MRKIIFLLGFLLISLALYSQEYTLEDKRVIGVFDAEPLDESANVLSVEIRGRDEFQRLGKANEISRISLERVARQPFFQLCMTEIRIDDIVQRLSAHGALHHSGPVPPLREDLREASRGPPGRRSSFGVRP